MKKKSLLPVLVFFIVLVSFPLRNAGASTDVVFKSFNRDFIEGTGGRCNTPNPGFVSICGQVRQTAILSSGGIQETNRPVKNAAINIYLGADSATRKTDGNITERYQQAVTNEDGIFNLGLQQGVGRDNKVYLAVSCGDRLADLYVVDTTKSFVNFDISVPCSTDAGSPSEAPTDLVYANRDGFLSCKEGDFADLSGSAESKSADVSVPLQDGGIDDKYNFFSRFFQFLASAFSGTSFFGTLPPGPTEPANEPLVGKYTQDTLFSLQDIPSTIYSVIGGIYGPLPSPKDPSYGSPELPLASCQDVLCCFNSISSDPACGNRNTQICGNIGTGLMSPYQDRDMCSATRTDLNKPICSDGGSDMTLGQFIDKHEVYPTWFCQPGGSSQASITTFAGNDSYVDNPGTPFVQTIRGIFPKEETEQFSIVKAVNVTSDNYDDAIGSPISYLASPYSDEEEDENGSSENSGSSTSLPEEGKYYRLGIAETLCGCLSEECLSTAEPINQPVNIAMFPTIDAIEASPKTPAYGYISENSEDKREEKFGIDFTNPTWYDDIVPTVLSHFLPPYEGSEEGVCLKTEDLGEGNSVSAYGCNGDVRDILGTKVSLQSPGAEVALGVRQLLSAFDVPYSPMPAVGGGYFIDTLASNETQPGVGKGKDFLLEDALNGAVAYADRLRQFVASPVIGSGAELNEPDFYMPMVPGSGPVEPVEINCDLNAPDISIPRLISKEQFSALADRHISTDNYGEECYNDVVRRAISNGINPAYLLFTWYIESGASNYTRSIEDFGVHIPSDPVIGFDAQIERSIQTFHSYYHNFCATNGIPPWPSKLYGHFACYVAGDFDQSGKNYQRLKERVQGYSDTFEDFWPEFAFGCPLPTGPADTSCP